jgi:hypothetical protein
LSALAVIKEAAESGVRVSLNGDNVALKATVRPSMDLLARFQKHKRGIVALLRQAAVPIRPAGYSDLEWLAAVDDAKRLSQPRETSHAVTTFIDGERR